MKDDSTFTTVGRKHYKCWSGKGASFSSQKSSAASNLILTSIEYAPNGDSVVGASDGKLMVFAGTSLKKSLEGHTQCIDSVAI